MCLPNPPPPISTPSSQMTYCHQLPHVSRLGPCPSKEDHTVSLQWEARISSGVIWQLLIRGREVECGIGGQDNSQSFGGN